MADAEEVDIAKIGAKLDTIIRLIAMDIAVDGDLTLQQKAVRLRRAGMMPKDIAELCDSTPNAVTVAISKARAKQNDQPKKEQ